MSAPGEPVRAARERLAAQRLDVAPPGARTPEPQLTSVIRLKITDVMVYERNPRRASHERIVELKESIRTNGIEQIVTVTRRPGAPTYVVAKGGNSRVTAATALYDETRDDRFLYYDFFYVPYPGEAKLLAAHLRENEQRADLCFWDKANGYLALKAHLEAERGETLSLREFSRHLEQEGTPVSHVLLALFQFAVDRLSALGPATLYLSRRALVDVIQPGLGILLRLARRLGHDDLWVQERVIDPQLAGIAARCNLDGHGIVRPYISEKSAPFDAAQLVDELRRRLAGELGASRGALERMCNLLERVPEATADELCAVGGIDVVRHGTSAVASSPATNETSTMRSTSASSERCAGEKEGAVETSGPAPDGVLPTSDSGSQLMAGDASGRLAPQAAPPAYEGESFRETVLAFARSCGLDGCIRDAPGLPYGFMTEPPPNDTPRFAPDSGAQCDEAALTRYLGWWWLVCLSRQNTATGLTRVPTDSVFSQMARDDDAWNRTCDASVGEPLLADRMDVMFDVMLNPEHPIGQWWAELIGAARAFRAAYPERFAPTRWPEPGADDRLRRGGP
ncbi:MULTISPECIES: chromosome partitioning protein ParB [Burkholderia cepacia complex]|uniref:chromosome partitioning protein ParB n=1 Tax=Burkholderia cepacia complex TaxID=87882 RepID=UPI001CF5D4F4|nr:MULTISPECIES: chromosome partitioning protein ParB [Burkholderia cepacia complex]MCA8057427.1 chromosome partitioning protein ParB [Burkholderia cepacia]MDN7534614.1 chromosome partitioning protein ParB [Burkholderia orbicola]